MLEREGDRSPDEPEDRADGTVLDEVEERLGFRAFFAKHRWLDLTYRVAVGDRTIIVFEQNKSRAPLPEQSAVILEWPTADNVVVKP